MSGEPGANTGAPTPENPAATPERGALVTATCPLCRAVLRQARVEPGGRIRCTNCGKRFAAKQEHDGGAKASAAAALADTKQAVAQPTDAQAAEHGRDAHATEQGRDARVAKAPPRSPGYWMLRVLALVLCAIATVTVLLVAQEHLMSFRYRTPRLDDALFLAYLPLAPWGGAFLVCLTRALAACDAGAVGRAWRCEVLREPLPRLPGSSLPYIGPLAVAGGVLPVMWYCAFPDEMDAALAGVLMGAGLLYLGFSLEDLRQFIWRQRALARACCQAVAEHAHGAQLGEAPRSGLLLGIAAVAAAVAVPALGLMPLSWRSWGQEDCLCVFIGAAILGVAYSLWLLGGDWDEAVAWWELAAKTAEEKAAQSGRDARGTAPDTQRQQSPRSFNWKRSVLLGTAVAGWLVLWADMAETFYYYSDAAVDASRVIMWVTGVFLFVVLSVQFAAWAVRFAQRTAPATLTPAMRCFCLFPLVWVAGETAWIVAMCIEHPPRSSERWGMLALWLGVVVFAAWLAAFLALARRWRIAQQRFFSLRDPEVSTLPVPPPAWQRWLVWGVVLLALGQAVLCGTWVWNQWVWRSVGRTLEFAGALPMVLVALHYPTIWVAMLVREWFAAERLYERRPEAEEG